MSELPVLFGGITVSQDVFVGKKHVVALPQGLHEVKTNDDDKTELVPIANFVPIITEDRRLDNGDESGDMTGEFRVEVFHLGCWSEVWVPAAQFDRLDWVTTEIGPSAVVFPRQGELLKAVTRLLSSQTFGGQIPRVVVPRHLGWMEGHPDGPVYLHASGAVGKDGPVPGVEVALPGDFSRYQLPVVPSAEALRDAVRSTFELLTVAPDSITFPLLAAVARAPLGDANLSVFLVGRTGTRKTSLAALCQQFFGREMDAEHLPASWSATANALEEQAFVAKDALLVVDDFVPRGSQREVADLHSKAERLFRGVANRSGRARLTPDSSLRPTHRPRALVLATGEDFPRGQSLLARLLCLEVEPGAVGLDKLTVAQAHANRGDYALAMAGFVQWTAARRDNIGPIRDALVPAERQRFLGHAAHPFTAAIASQLGFGFHMWCQYAVEAGAIDAAEHDDLITRARSAFQAALSAQGHAHRESDPVDQYLELVAATLSSGQAHLATPKGGTPTNSLSWGWREEDGVTRPKGACIGWIDGDHVYLHPANSYGIAEAQAKRVGESLATSRPTLGRRLRTGLLRSSDDTRQTTTIRKLVQGVRTEVWHFDSALFGAGPVGDNANPSLTMWSSERTNGHVDAAELTT